VPGVRKASARLDLLASTEVEHTAEFATADRGSNYAGVQGKHAADELSPSTRELVEQLLTRMGATAGHWRVSIEARDGRCLNVDLSEVRIPASDLARFDAMG